MTDQNINRRTNFIYHTDPNGPGGANNGMEPSWPAYGDKRRTTLRFGSEGNTLIRDDFHEEQIAYFFDKQAMAW
jgi:carboxylesterase type B